MPENEITYCIMAKHVRSVVKTLLSDSGPLRYIDLLLTKPSYYFKVCVFKSDLNTSRTEHTRLAVLFTTR